MLLSPEMLLPMGPPPEAVLEQRGLWQTLALLLGLTFALRLLGLDMAGALLTGLMLCLTVLMLRDGMQELSKYALVYAVLCGLSFFFDVLPLLTEMDGRVTRTTQHGPSVVGDHGSRQTTYILTTKITPFFSAKEGLIYNAQSASMVLSPICMAIGMYLATSAHNELQRHTRLLNGDDFEDFPFSSAAGVSIPPEASGGTRSRGGGEATLPGASVRSGLGREPLERFAGTPHKLVA